MKYQIEADSSRGMKVPVTIYADEGLISKMMIYRTILQAINVSTIPGILGHAELIFCVYLLTVIRFDRLTEARFV